MPAANLSDLGLADKSPAELESLRQSLMETVRQDYKSNLDEVPTDMLNRLAVIIQSLRRKNAGPPKVAKASKASRTPAQTDDFAV